MEDENWKLDLTMAKEFYEDACKAAGRKLEIEPFIKEDKNKYYIQTVDIKNGDTILITFDLNECDMDEAREIFKMYQEQFPNNKIVAQIYPLVKSMAVIKTEPKEENEIKW